MGKLICISIVIAALAAFLGERIVNLRWNIGSLHVETVQKHLVTHSNICLFQSTNQ